MKKEEYSWSFVSSSNSVLQQKNFQNSNIKTADSIIEHKSSSFKTDQAPSSFQEAHEAKVYGVQISNVCEDQLFNDECNKRCQTCYEKVVVS